MSRQVCIARAVDGQEHDGLGVERMNLGADEQFQPHGLGRRMSPHHAGQALAIRYGQRGIAQFGGPGHEFIRMRRPGKERIVRLRMQLGITHPRRACPPGSEQQVE